MFCKHVHLLLALNSDDLFESYICGFTEFFSSFFYSVMIIMDVKYKNLIFM